MERHQLMLSSSVLARILPPDLSPMGAQAKSSADCRWTSLPVCQPLSKAYLGLHQPKTSH